VAPDSRREATVLKRAVVALGWLLALSSVAASGQARTPSNVLVLVGGRYLAIREGGYRPNGAIVISGGRITAMLPPGVPLHAPADAVRIEVDDQTILPGLIDAHVHLTITGDPAANAAATLRAGFTTVADLGSAGGAGARLRDRIAGGSIPGPRVIAAGSWIGARGGVCEFGGATVVNAAAAAARARSDLAAGADVLKICVTGWPADAVAHPDSVEFAADQIRAVVTVAATARRRVVAHAIGQAGALLAAELGVAALAHTPIVDAAGAARLGALGIVVISTAATLSRGPGGDRILASLRRLHTAGVPIVFGTDAGVLPHGQNAMELAALVRAGFTSLAALRAATIDAAAFLDRTDLGEIAVGAAGDLLLVRGDPLGEVITVARPTLIIQGGRVVAAGGRPTVAPLEEPRPRRRP